VRTLYDCPDVAVGPTGLRCRVVVATHPASARKRRIGLTRTGLVYELFFSQLPQDAFTAADIVALYLHRGAFEPVLADEDQEQDPDRWSSHAPSGQQVWQIISPWVAESPPRARSSAQTDADADHRVCSRRPRGGGSSQHLPRALPRRLWPPPGKQVASLAMTLPSNQMGRCAVRLPRRFVCTSGARKPMEAYAWSTRPASTVAAPVLSVSSVNGMAKPRANLVR
jgi:hypothetical protein